MREGCGLGLLLLVAFVLAVWFLVLRQEMPPWIVKP